MSEQELIRKMKNGDKDAFCEIMALYEKRVYNYALRMVHNPDDALDISQETFIKLYSGIKNFKEESAFSTYLYRIMVNCCKDFLKKNGRLSAMPLYTEDEDGEELALQIENKNQCPEAEYEKKELKELLIQATNSLNEPFKQVFVLKDINNLSYEEIADTLNIDIGTVKSRLFRAREKIRTFILNKGNNYDYFKSK